VQYLVVDIAGENELIAYGFTGPGQVHLMTD
jgi:hypothetical protein